MESRKRTYILREHFRAVKWESQQHLSKSSRIYSFRFPFDILQSQLGWIIAVCFLWPMAIRKVLLRKDQRIETNVFQILNTNTIALTHAQCVYVHIQPHNVVVFPLYFHNGCVNWLFLLEVIWSNILFKSKWPTISNDFYVCRSRNHRQIIKQQTVYLKKTPTDRNYGCHKALLPHLSKG